MNVSRSSAPLLIIVPRLIMPILALLAAGCASAPRAKHEGASRFIGASKVHRYSLANGLKILIVEDHSSPTFAYHTWYKVGSKDEQKGLTGLAHLFEHMMFKQTKNRKPGEFDRLLEAAGAEGENAFTSRDYTGYVQSLPSERLDLIAELEADRMANLIVDETALDTEREVVQNERRFRKENNPDGQLYERLYQLAFTKHSYQWPVIGYEADLVAAKQRETAAFYKRFYAPNNATIVIVGDVSPNEAVKTIVRHYGNLRPSVIDRKESPKEPAQKEARVETKKLKIKVEKLTLAYHSVDINSPDFPALEALRCVLSVGKGSRFYKKLVDGGLATDADIENSETHHPGLFGIFVNMQKGRSAKQALEVVDRELQRVASGDITKAELDRAVTMQRFEAYDGLASNYRKAQFLGFYETVAGRFERGVDILDAIKAITPKDVARVAKTYLKPETRTVVIGVPGDE